MDSPDTRHSNEKTDCKTSVKCLLVGSSNCRGLVIPGDDDLGIQQTSRIIGGLKIKDSASKLHDIPNSELNEFQAVVLHVGSTDFPVNTEKDFETHYMEYVENLSEISTMCPKSVILVSSVLPRNERYGSKTNRKIRLFNDKLKALTENESNLVYVDHSSYLVEGDQIQTSLYRKNDSENIHLNTLGREKLAVCVKWPKQYTINGCYNTYYLYVVAVLHTDELSTWVWVKYYQEKYL